MNLERHSFQITRQLEPPISRGALRIHQNFLFTLVSGMQYTFRKVVKRFYHILGRCFLLTQTASLTLGYALTVSLMFLIMLVGFLHGLLLVVPSVISIFFRPLTEYDFYLLVQGIIFLSIAYSFYVTLKWVLPGRILIKKITP